MPRQVHTFPVASGARVNVLLSKPLPIFLTVDVIVMLPLVTVNADIQLSQYFGLGYSRQSFDRFSSLFVQSIYPWIIKIAQTGLRYRYFPTKGRVKSSTWRCFSMSLIQLLAEFQ